MKAIMPRELVVKLRFILSMLFLATCFWACDQQPVQVWEEVMIRELNGSDVMIKRYAIARSEEGAFKKAPLVIVHGGPVMDHSYLLPHLDALAREYQLIFYDQRACGASSIDIDSASMNLDGFVEDIELLRKELNLEKINLFGHSWGGLLALKYGILHSQRLDRLVLSNGMAPSVADWQKETYEIGKRVTQKDLQERQTLISSGALQSEDPREAVRTLLRQSFKHQMYDTANLDRLDLFVPIDYVHRSRLFGLLSADLQSFNLYEDLSKVECPTLLVYGETELAPSLYVSKMLEKLPNGRLEVVSKSGHFPFIEQPAEFAATVLDFLKK